MTCSLIAGRLPLRCLAPASESGWHGGAGGLLVAVITALAVGGCGPHIPHGHKPRADVGITVTAGGQPVSSGFVNLVNDATGEGGGDALDATGRARLSGIVHGDYVVTVAPRQEEVVPSADGRPTVAAAADRQVAIPRRFHTAATSPLRLSVGREGNEFTFDLQQTPVR